MGEAPSSILGFSSVSREWRLKDRPNQSGHFRSSVDDRWITYDHICTTHHAPVVQWQDRCPVSSRSAFDSSWGLVKLYYQCRLRQGCTETIGWIEARGAKVGVSVELLPDRGLWEVLTVSGPALSEHLLKEHQRMHRGSLPSVERMA